MEHAFFHLFLLLCSSPSNPNAWKSQRMQLHTLTAILASRRDAVNLAWPPVYASAASDPDMDGWFFQPPFLWLSSDIPTEFFRVRPDRQTVPGVVPRRHRSSFPTALAATSTRAT
eukprot:scaffold101178_cov60-Phaeocystis_antarctica.AAC.1